MFIWGVAARVRNLGLKALLPPIPLNILNFLDINQLQAGYCQVSNGEFS